MKRILILVVVFLVGCSGVIGEIEEFEAEPRQSFGSGEMTQLIESFDEALPEFGIFDTATYHQSWPLRSLLYVYEATENKKYIEIVLKSIEHNIRKMKDVDSDGYKEFDFGLGLYNHDGDPSTPKRSACLDVERGARAYTKAVRLIMKSPDLKKLYGARAQKVLAVIKHDIVKNPECRKRFTADFKTVQHIVSHNLMILVNLYLIEGDRTYHDGKSYTYYQTIKSKIKQMKNSWHDQSGGAIAWNSVSCTRMDYNYPKCYRLDGACKGCSPVDTSHSNDVIDAVIELHRNGVKIRRSDIDKFINTFLTKIWDQNATDPMFRDFVDGRLEPPDGKYGKPYLMGSNIYVGWGRLGLYSEQIHNLLVAARLSDKTNKRFMDDISYYATLIQTTNTRPATVKKRYFCSCGDGREQGFRKYWSSLLKSSSACSNACPEDSQANGWKVRSSESGDISSGSSPTNPYMCACRTRKNSPGVDHFWTGLVAGKAKCESLCPGTDTKNSWVFDERYSGYVTDPKEKKYFCSCQNKQTGQIRYWSGLRKSRASCQSICAATSVNAGWYFTESWSGTFGD